MTRLHFFATLAAAVLLACACSGTNPRGGSRSLKLATWNLEHLAEHDGSGCRARVEADYAALRAVVDRLDADVIAFEEVENLAAARRVFTPDEYTIAMSTRPDHVRAGFCRRDATSGPTIRKQDVGFAIRKSIAFTRNPDLDALALGNADLRWGVDITLEGRKPLRLLALHLKSGCSQGTTSEACPVLFDQVPVLQSWIAARQSEGIAFALLGDWNRRLALADDGVWQRLNNDGVALTDAAAGRAAHCVERYPDFIDHIVLDANAAARMQADSFEEFDYGVAESEHPSDHCPVAVSVER